MTVGLASFDLNVLGAPLNRAVKWTPAGGLEALPLPEPSDLNFNSLATHILDDGRIFGHSNSGTWLYSEQTGFEMLPVGSYMTQINSTGDFMIGTKLVDDFVTFPHRATYWTPETGEVQLTPLAPDIPSTVIAMSDDGSIIIGQGTLGFYLWFDQGDPILLTDYAESIGIDMSGWFINNVYAISADGTTIVGTGAKLEWGTGRSEGFVLTIPAPGAAVVLGFSGLFACRRRR